MWLSGAETFAAQAQRSISREQSLTSRNVIESRYYRIRFDPTTGGIVSIHDKEMDRELVDPGAPWQLNQYLYVTGGKGTRIVMNPSTSPCLH